MCSNISVNLDYCQCQHPITTITHQHIIAQLHNDELNTNKLLYSKPCICQKMHIGIFHFERGNASLEICDLKTYE